MEQLIANLEGYGLTNQGAKWVLASVLTVGITLVGIVLRRVVVKNLRRLAERPTFFGLRRMANVLDQTYFLSYLALGLYAGGAVLRLPETLKTTGQGILLTVIFIQIGIWGASGIRTFLDTYRDSIDGDESQTTGLSILHFVGQTIVWIGVLLLILDNLGFDITTLLASLGIGGIAVALAAQNILGDLFASLSIVIDKPFVVGDFIIVGEKMGTVERVGLKTTRLRSLGGEELIFSNQDLLQSRVQNYKRMEERRIRFTFSVVYQTPAEKVREIPQIVENVITPIEKTRFDRAHFNEFAESSLEFEIVYYVLDPDYNTYMDIHQQILLGLFDRFEEKQIQFAYPTRTVFQGREETG